MKFEKKSIIINNRNYFYWLKNKNSKNVIILLHGFPGNHMGLIELADSLGEDYRVIAPDLPACGKSDKLLKKHDLKNYADWLKVFLEKLFIDEAIIIGHSFGSRVALIFCINYPQKVKKLVLITPVVKRDGMIDYLASLRYKIAKLLPYYLQKIYLADKSYQYLSAFFVFRSGKKLQKKIIARNIKELKKLDPKIQIQLFDEFYKMDFTGFGKKIKVKSLIIAGNEDKIATLESISQMACQINNTLLKIMKNAGHLVPIERPLAVSKIIKKWLNNKK